MGSPKILAPQMIAQITDEMASLGCSQTVLHIFIPKTLSSPQALREAFKKRWACLAVRHTSLLHQSQKMTRLLMEKIYAKDLRNLGYQAE